MKHPAFLALGFALALTAAFHFFFAEAPYGLPQAIMVVLTLLGIHAMLFIAGHRGSRWAYVFLIPVLFSTVAKLLYANEAVSVLGFMVTAVSLAFYTYWITMPRLSFSQIRSFWPVHFFTETLWPFRSIDKVLTDLQRGNEGKRVLLGLFLSIPFLFWIGALFASADPFFSKTMGDLFQNFSLSEIIGKTIRDAIAGFFFLGSGWMVYTRAMEKREPAHQGDVPDRDVITLNTFLTALNTLFVVFVGFQAAYFFGGEDFIRSQEIAYAQYARNGFFELIAVAGIVFALSWLAYHVTELRRKSTRILVSLLIIQTGVVLLSAFRRLWLYVDVYGLSVSRWWAFASIAIIALVLTLILVGALARWHFSKVAKSFSLGTLLIVSALLLVNVEGMVVKVNAGRFVSGQTVQLDLDYMLHDLSSDSVPALVAFSTQDWSRARDVGGGNIESQRRTLINSLDQKSGDIYKKFVNDWRLMSLADYFAVRAIATIPPVL